MSRRLSRREANVNSLMEMAQNNALEQLAHKIKRTGREVAALEELQRLLGMPSTPIYIEAYDISNWGETGRVAE